MAEIVKFVAPSETQAAVIDVLEQALVKAKAGQLADVAVIGALRDENGPQQWFSYYGEGAYAVLVAGTAALTFDLQWRRYHPDQEPG